MSLQQIAHKRLETFIIYLLSALRLICFELFMLSSYKAWVNRVQQGKIGLECVSVGQHCVKAGLNLILSVLKTL